jgi:hypothetical protein
MSRTIVLAGVVATAALLAGSLAHASVSSHSTPALTGPFVGSWAAKLSYNQAYTLGDPRMYGRFRLVLRRNGTYTAANPLDGTMSGRLAALPGKRLRFFADTGCTAGGFERPKGGIYRWSLNAGKLTLRLVSEGPCSGRTQTLTYPVWKRR